jgi:hypothetical protein
MSTQDIILITMSIPMVSMIIVLSMINHEYKKVLRKKEEDL